MCLFLSLAVIYVGFNIVLNPEDFVVRAFSGPLSVGMQKDGLLLGMNLMASEESFTESEVKLGIFSRKIRLKTSESSLNFSSGIRLPDMTPWAMIEFDHRGIFPIPSSSAMGYGIWTGGFLFYSRSNLRIPLAVLSGGYKSEFFTTGAWSYQDTLLYLNTSSLDLRFRRGGEYWYIGIPIKSFDSLGEYGVALGLGRYVDSWCAVLDVDVFKTARLNPVFLFDIQNGSASWLLTFNGHAGRSFTLMISPEEAFLAVGW
ncbi:MAG: hypothetical protein PWP37_354 [Thermotogota bacterium]|nr:hypothetical protein [Thermotogota bacterium]